MNKEVRDEWVKRLRSGDYEQGVAYLRRTDGEVSKYCCLGVLCEIAVEAGIIPPAQPKEMLDGVWMYGEGADADDVGLPFAVRKWAGLGSGTGVVIGGIVTTLIDANDVERMSFSAIADIIETHPIN